MIFLLELLLSCNISLNYFAQVTNAFIYDKEIIKLLKYLEKKGTTIKLWTNMDQFHQSIPKKNVRKFKKLSFYHYYFQWLMAKDIVKLGNALKNDIGNQELTEIILRDFDGDVFPSLKIENVNPITIDSFYVTAKGYFGSEPTDATWDMIDEKYTLNVLTDSLFANARISDFATFQIEKLRVFEEFVKNDLESNERTLYRHK